MRCLSDFLVHPGVIVADQVGSEFPIEIMLSPLESAEGILVTAAIRNISVRRSMDGLKENIEAFAALGVRF